MLQRNETRSEMPQSIGSFCCWCVVYFTGKFLLTEARNNLTYEMA